MQQEHARDGGSRAGWWLPRGMLKCLKVTNQGARAGVIRGDQEGASAALWPTTYLQVLGELALSFPARSPNLQLASPTELTQSRQSPDRSGATCPQLAGQRGPPCFGPCLLLGFWEEEKPEFPLDLSFIERLLF